MPLSDLRLLTVRHYGWDGKVTTGQLVVNEDFARPLVGVFRRLYELKFPIRHMRFADQYGPGPEPRDTSGSFHCRPPAASPCPGSKPSSNWSMHAYGLAVDLNPRENPYVGCGVSYHADAKPYIDRTRLRKGMVTPGCRARVQGHRLGLGRRLVQRQGLDALLLDRALANRSRARRAARRAG